MPIIEISSNDSSSLASSPPPPSPQPSPPPWSWSPSPPPWSLLPLLPHLPSLPPLPSLSSLSPPLSPSPSPSPSPARSPSPAPARRYDSAFIPLDNSDEEVPVYGADDTWDINTEEEPLFCGDPLDHFEIYDRLTDWARDNKFGLIIERSRQRKKTGETHRRAEKNKGARKTNSRKKAKDYPFRIVIQHFVYNNGWTARPLCLIHKGHGPFSSPSEYEMFRRRVLKEE
ncbi:hypothetical protein B0T24DRAFT_596557 [Lasiosphaeria ovina]|uniref:Uncharacterized protein n=1 Tax=Lasiosphaeria ovina TaxID=92902 RepID=A0AAE0N0S8_9PEZI|nr:hypothetical protein B0T24DRAFT_596557 [Lasiosphaeria ovina]